MEGYKGYGLVLLAGLILGLTVSPVQAGYINYSGLNANDFALLSTAWDPGVATARFGGNPAPGGATWSVMGAGIGDVTIGAQDPHGGNLTSVLTALYAGGVDEITTIGITLSKWAAVSLFTNLGMVGDGGGGFGAAGAAGAVGDIRVGAIFIDGNVGLNTLAHAFQPGTPVQFLSGNLGGDVHMDNSNVWGDTPVAVAGVLDYHTVMLHELGHSVGLDHSLVVGAVMEALYAGPRRTLSADDIAGIQAIYGAPVVAVPEPTTLLLLGFGLMGLLSGSRFRKLMD